jgi:hypothetical protein
VIELLRRKPGSQAALFSEAQALVDDGLDAALVLELYPDEAPWLAGLLDASSSVAQAATTLQPSYYFEASLKRKFLAAGARNAGGVRRGPVIALSEPQHRFRTALAGTALVGAAAAIGVATIVSLRTTDSTGGGTPNGGHSEFVSRLDTHLNEAQHHIDQFTQRASVGQIDEADVTILEGDANTLAALAQSSPLDDDQKERAQEFVDKAVTVLTAAQDKPDLKPRAETAIETISQAAVAAGLSGVTPLTPVATATATPTGDATPGATVSPTVSATTTATTTGTVDVTATTTAESTASSTVTPTTSAAATTPTPTEPLGTATPAETPTPHS